MLIPAWYTFLSALASATRNLYTHVARMNARSDTILTRAINKCVPGPSPEEGQGVGVVGWLEESGEGGG